MVGRSGRRRAADRAFRAARRSRTLESRRGPARPLQGARRRRRDVRGSLHRGPRPSRGDDRRVRGSEDTAVLRRTASSRPPASRRAGSAAPRPRALRALRGGSLGRANPGGAACHRRAPAGPRARARGADRAGAADRAPGGGGEDQPADRRDHVPEPEDDRVPSRPGLPQARHRLTGRADPPFRRPDCPAAAAGRHAMTREPPEAMSGAPAARSGVWKTSTERCQRTGGSGIAATTSPVPGSRSEPSWSTATSGPSSTSESRALGSGSSASARARAASSFRSSPLTRARPTSVRG